MRRSSRKSARMACGISPSPSPTTRRSARRVGRRQIAPALKGAAGLRAGGDEHRIEHDAATGDAVLPGIGPEVDNALAHQDDAPDHPVERPAVEHLVAPPRRLQVRWQCSGVLPACLRRFSRSVCQSLSSWTVSTPTQSLMRWSVILRLRFMLVIIAPPSYPARFAYPTRAGSISRQKSRQTDASVNRSDESTHGFPL